MAIEKNRINGWEFGAALALWAVFEYTIRVWKFWGAAQYHLESAILIWILLLYFRAFKRCDKLVPELPTIQALKNIFPAYLALFVILVPLGLKLGFLKFSPELSRAPKIFLMYFIFVAGVEEVMWRGVVQTFFSQYFKSFVAIAIASVLFGLIHLHKGGGFPNYPYVLLATIAGGAYGYVFKKYGLRESILLHTLVDTTWHSFFK